MVGGFSLTPSLQFCPSTSLTPPRTPPAPFSAVAIFIMLLLHAAALDIRPTWAVSTAGPATGSIQKITYRHRLGSEEKLQLPKPQHVTTATTTRLHRHLLKSGGPGVGSRRNADQASRALVGSSPPKCVKKCKACTPCKSVLVPIHTNNLPATPAEYYPEAWRCQCRGKIYNP